MRVMRDCRHPHTSGGRSHLSLLFAHQVPRDAEQYQLHITNVGAIAARAASWRQERRGEGSPHVYAIVSDLPGSNIVVASVDRGGDPRETVEIILRWVQPGGVVDESVHTLS